MNNPKWYDIALAEIGQKEIVGNQDNPRIQEYLKTVFNYSQHDEVAWCSAFVNWVLLRDGYEGTHSALARSWLWWGEKLAKPERGAICIFSRGIETWQGHVGFFDSMEGGRLKILGGNQNNSVCFETYSPTRLIGIRWPKKK